MDSSGNLVNAAVALTPASVVLKPGETAEITASIAVQEPLVSGRNYYAEIHLRGCSRKPIGIEVSVEGEECIDYYAVCDPCRPGHGRFVEVCDDDPCHRKPDRHSCWDPHQHWHEICDWLLLPPFAGARGWH